MLRQQSAKAATPLLKWRAPRRRCAMRRPTGRPRSRCSRNLQCMRRIAGTIYSLNVNATEFAEQGKLLLQMADLHQERVRAYFDEPEIGKLAVGQPILIKWDAKPGKVWHGHIERTPITVITYGTRNVGEVLIHIDDVDGQLLPETNVTVTVTTSSQANALSIPREALRSENGKTYVYKIDGDELKKDLCCNRGAEPYAGCHSFRAAGSVTGWQQEPRPDSRCKKTSRSRESGEEAHSRFHRWHGRSCPAGSAEVPQERPCTGECRICSRARQTGRSRF